MRCRHPPIPTSVALLVLVSLLAAGCGGGAPQSATAITTMQTGAVAFARCMRAHGLSNWPDPNSNGGFDKSKLRQTGYSVSQVRAIEDRDCNNLLPNGGNGPQETTQQTRARIADALSFARCMRARGFPNFPDPTNQGLLTPRMVTAAGIDLHQPRLLKAGLACVPVTHGWLTRAAIERAVNGG
jgi:hypothetical protein